MPIVFLFPSKQEPWLCHNGTEFKSILVRLPLSASLSCRFHKLSRVFCTSFGFTNSCTLFIDIRSKCLSPYHVSLQDFSQSEDPSSLIFPSQVLANFLFLVICVIIMIRKPKCLFYSILMYLNAVTNLLSTLISHLTIEDYFFYGQLIL